MDQFTQQEFNKILLIIIIGFGMYGVYKLRQIYEAVNGTWTDLLKVGDAVDPEGEWNE